MSFLWIGIFSLVGAVWLFAIGLISGADNVVLAALCAAAAGWLAGMVAMHELVREGRL